MEDTSFTVYIIDLYQKYTRDKVIFTFSLNGRNFCVKEVQLEWGIPKLSSIEQESEQPYFHIYNTLEEAREYVRQLKQLEGARL